MDEGQAIKITGEKMGEQIDQRRIKEDAEERKGNGESAQRQSPDIRSSSPRGQSRPMASIWMYYKT